MLVYRENRVRDGMDAKVGADPVEGASTLVYILGIGFMIYVGLEYVLPALFGASAKTRSAYQRLRGERREEPRYQSQFRPAYGESSISEF